MTREAGEFRGAEPDECSHAARIEPPLLLGRATTDGLTL
jgi:hypothetical protein